MERLDRFIKAQENTYSTALKEVQSGRKVGHWICYIFPQIKGLGHSANSEYYGIEDADEAKNYINHSILGARLREITQELLNLPSHFTAEKIFGMLDALKVKSSMTLFYCVSKEELFVEVLNRFYNGDVDKITWYKVEENFALLLSLYKNNCEECNQIIDSLGYYEATRTVDVTTLPFSFEIDGHWYLLDGFGFNENEEFYALVADLHTGPPDLLEVDATAIPDNIVIEVLSVLQRNIK